MGKGTKGITIRNNCGRELSSDKPEGADLPPRIYALDATSGEPYRQLVPKALDFCDYHCAARYFGIRAGWDIADHRLPGGVTASSPV